VAVVGQRALEQHSRPGLAGCDDEGVGEVLYVLDATPSVAGAFADGLVLAGLLTGVVGTLLITLPAASVPGIP
jgi:hypothetical protein